MSSNLLEGLNQQQKNNLNHQTLLVDDARMHLHEGPQSLVELKISESVSNEQASELQITAVDGRMSPNLFQMTQTQQPLEKQDPDETQILDIPNSPKMHSTLAPPAIPVEESIQIQTTSTKIVTTTTTMRSKRFLLDINGDNPDFYANTIM